MTTVRAGAITREGDRDELSFIIASATPCEVRFGQFLAQIAPSLHNIKRALNVDLSLDLDKLANLRLTRVFRYSIYPRLWLLFRAIMVKNISQKSSLVAKELVPFVAVKVITPHETSIL